MSRRYPAEPARQLLREYADRYDATVTELAVLLRLDRRTVQRAFNRPDLREDTADRIAVAFGRHPCELWLDWFDLDTRRTA